MGTSQMGLMLGLTEDTPLCSRGCIQWRYARSLLIRGQLKTLWRKWAGVGESRRELARVGESWRELAEAGKLRVFILFFLVRMDQGEDEADDHGDEADAEEDEEDGEEGLHNPIDKDTIIILPEQSAKAISQAICRSNLPSSFVATGSGNRRQSCGGGIWGEKAENPATTGLPEAPPILSWQKLSDKCVRSIEDTSAEGVNRRHFGGRGRSGRSGSRRGRSGSMIGLNWLSLYLRSCCNFLKRRPR